jgi:lysozyme
MIINQKGLDLIKSFEGCKLKAYQDIRGIWTIGYGHTGSEVKEGMEITQEQADGLLKENLHYFENGVDHFTSEPLNENQFSAMVCFSYNCGLGSLVHSSILKCVNAGDFQGAADSFLLWNKSGGMEVPGLTRRREAERELFLATPEE